MADTEQEYDSGIEVDVFDTPTENEQHKENQKKLLIPVGWARVENPVLFTPEHPEKDPSRRVGRFFAQLVDLKTGEPVGKLGFRVSPDLRYKEGTEKADWNYQMYLRARKTFIAATGSEPQKDRDLMQYLVDYPYDVRVIQTEDGENMIVGFREAKD